MTRTCTRPPRGFCAGPGPGGPSLDDDSDCGVVVSAPACAAIYALLGALLSRRPMAIQDRPRCRRDREAATLRRVLLEGLHMSDRPVRYCMIVLDAAPSLVRLRGAPLIFHSPEEKCRVCTAARRPALDGLWRPRGLVASLYTGWANQPASRAQGSGRYQPASLIRTPAPEVMLDGSLLGG